jgi:hypothetical protein
LLQTNRQSKPADASSNNRYVNRHLFLYRPHVLWWPSRSGRRRSLWYGPNYANSEIEAAIARFAKSNMKPTKITLAQEKTPGVNENPLSRDVRPCSVPTGLLRYGEAKLRRGTVLKIVYSVF